MACWSVEKSVYNYHPVRYGKPTVLVSLDLNNHLLQAVDDLFAAFLWHLALEVLTGALTELASSLLLLLAGVLVHAVLQSTSRGIGTGRWVHACALLALALLLSGKVGSISWIARTRWVGSLGGVTSCVLQILLANWNGAADLLLDLSSGEIGGLVPCVVLGWLVNLLQCLLVRVDFGGSLLCGVTSNIAEKSDGILHCGESALARRANKFPWATYRACGIDRW